MTQNSEKETDFLRNLKTTMSRRTFLRDGASLGATAFVMGSANFSTATTRTYNRNSFAFSAVPASTKDTISVPEDFNWHVVVRWGDPLWSNGPNFDQSTRGTSSSQALAFGDNNDGMELFIKGNRSILAVNNEATNLSVMYGNHESNLPENADDIRKGKAAVGISIIEISPQNGRWSIVKDSDYNRRITADLPMKMTGPARGHKLLRTNADPEGTNPIGTWSNCGSGRTPWGTYLACEENFNHYFSSSDPLYELTNAMKRYGIDIEDRGYDWGKYDERFDISKNPNEPNRFGYIVEVDPLDPLSTPKKRSALGRFKHENAAVVLSGKGHVVVYMGDDEHGEFLYRFISKERYHPSGDNSDLLEEGSLYVAKFHDDMSGEWMELEPQTTGMISQAEICIYTRQAASAVKATTMDRPEWIATNPNKVEAYCCLTNNKNRGKKPNAGGDETPVNGPNPRIDNMYGQIVRWTPTDKDHTNSGFAWDLFVLAGNPTAHSDLYAGSKNINQNNLFNSPDGITVDNNGLMWIRTDGIYSNEGDFAGMGNNQMLVADTTTGEIKRFLVGPIECEITGLAWSADKKTLFLGIQHPGDKGGGHFPDGGKNVPRSSIIAIKRNDGQTIG